MPITEQMILECYDAWRNGNRTHVPDGMNVNSANMTMLWLDSLFNGRPYHRDGSAMQYRVILERIREDYGPEQARFARDVLLGHCEWSLENHGKPMHRHRDVLRHF
jgi:hypothetical protein